MLENIAAFCIRFRIAVLGLLMLVTAGAGYLASGTDIRTEFTDLLPQDHPYVQINNQYKNSFGGANLVSIMMGVEEGDIFTIGFLSQLRDLTRDLRLLSAVDSNQITSLATRKLKEIRASTYEISTRPLMWPDIPENQEQLDQLRQSVINNNLVFGQYVSRDLKSALITVDFFEAEIEYSTVFREIRETVDKYRAPGLSIRVVGDPILYGWVHSYLPETFNIFLATIAGLALILFFTARTWRGTLLPMISGTVSAIWALGIANLLGYNFDPLVIVLAFLISARSISHAVQMVTRFDAEVRDGALTATAAAKVCLGRLFQPGMLGVATDAGAMMVVALTPIPLLEKVAFLGAIWVSTILITVFVLVPVLLSYVRLPARHGSHLSVTAAMDWFGAKCARLSAAEYQNKVLITVLVIFVASGAYAFKLTVGDADPGSPILWPDSEFNRDSAILNSQFAGSDRMFLTVAGHEIDAIKRPEVLITMGRLQRYMEAQPEIGGTVSVADIIPSIMRVLREGNPRYEELGTHRFVNGEIMYIYVSNSDPGDMERFLDIYAQDASITAFFRDRKGQTIRTAISRIKGFVEANPMEFAEIKLAGGLIGVIAAVNEVILRGQISSIALALLMVVFLCAMTYRSVSSGMFFMVPVLIANTLTFSFMAWKGIGMNINTVPVAALGIGLGVDYSFYVVDRIKEELAKSGDMQTAISATMYTAGRAVMITAGTLCAAVLIWTVSSLRFQAEMGLLMGLWLVISALCALIVMPAMVAVFKPAFVVGDSLSRGDPSVAEK